jgi:diguanylate cyclase (GGDEF)-like protein
MSCPSFLQAITRHRIVFAPIVAQGAAILVLCAGHPIAAAAVACLGITVLAFLLAAADDRETKLRAERDNATARITQLEAELAEAYTDPVTGLPVRRLAERHLTNAIGVQLTVAVTDVDDMHDINNSRDHQFGDEYLAGIAQRLQQAAGDGDVLARLGGDEFVIITTRTPLALAHALADVMRQPITINGTDMPVQLSVGICRLFGGDAHLGLGRADRAMYTAKRRRSGIEHYDPARDGQPQPPGVRPAVRHRNRHTGTSRGDHTT